MGSMLKHGYIDNIKNSVLVTVENPDTQKGVALQEKLTTEVNNMSMTSMPPPVISSNGIMITTIDSFITQL